MAAAIGGDPRFRNPIGFAYGPTRRVECSNQKVNGKTMIRIYSKIQGKSIVEVLDSWIIQLELTNLQYYYCHAEAIDRLHVEDDLNEPTLGEKLVRLNVLDDEKANTLENHRSPIEAKPPSADSVHVLLKQALHADDRALMLDCLYTQDEKVIENSTSLLNPSDVLKLLDSLVSMIQSRGAVLACALPWLRNLLLQQASCIMPQESSLLTLNSLYQLIESRMSTFCSALKLSSCLDYLFVGISGDVADETSMIKPVVYEDKDESDEDDPEVSMETDEDSEEAMEAINGFSDFEESD
ncbi:WD repeat-containing protein 43-like [Macadamia integrifolia]|uniref:WD repeat-containing protein 43-like n=1 Tax=Macadamia integrifolia TaxID=60698 RepID=UPI001C4F216D|nr:WD repeat-containing protein 43-like [Macadamia integrifolia]